MIPKLRFRSSNLCATNCGFNFRIVSRFHCKVVSEKEYTNHLKICADSKAILHGRVLHCRFLKVLANPQTILLNSLAQMYLKCGFISHAEQVFDEIPEKDVVSWNTMIKGYVSYRYALDAFMYFKLMLISGSAPDQFSLSSVLEGCVINADLSLGQQVHGVVIKLGLCHNVFVCNGLMELYNEFDCFSETMKAFDRLESKDDVVINTMIKVYAKMGNDKEAFKNLLLIASEYGGPSRATFVNFLSAISGGENLSKGLQVHGSLMKYGFEDHGAVENSLVRMYCNCGAMAEGFYLLVHKGSKNVMSWTTLISQYNIHRCFQDALNVFQWLYHNEVISIDESVLACLLNASAALKLLHMGTQIHSIVVKTGTFSSEDVTVSLLDMYANCFCLNSMQEIFLQVGENANLQVWTTMISGNIRNGLPFEALNIFSKMLNAGIEPDAVACVSILTGCSYLQTIEHGEMLHAYVVKSGKEATGSVQTALIALYSDLGCFNCAEIVIESMTEHDVVSITALIQGYARFGFIKEASFWFRRMLNEGVAPNNFTFACMLTASAKSSSIVTGQLLHSLIIKGGMANDNIIASSMVDMYSKCGDIQDAVHYFNNTQEKDIVVWNSLLVGLSHHGYGVAVLKAFDEMQIDGIKPDNITFLSVLCGCSHGALADQVMEKFNLMCEGYGVIQMVEHYACVVDALGRAGLFNKAVKFIEKLNLVPCVLILRSLLSCCVLHECVHLGSTVVAKMIVLEGYEVSTLVLFSKLCAVNGKWDDTLKSREIVKRLQQQPLMIGNSWIESKSLPYLC